MVDLANPTDVRQILSRHGIWLTKSLGQHLLVDRMVLDHIVEAAHLTNDSQVLEVGPGAGALTRELSRRAARVVAIEIDRRFVAVLRETVAEANVTVVQADALQIDAGALFAGHPFKLVANLPYGVATPLLRKLLYAPERGRPDEMVVMVQREVAYRLAGRRGHVGILSIATTLAADVALLFDVPPSAFFPPPEVVSTVVRLRPLPGLRVPLQPSEQRFFQTVEAGFRQRRKQLHNALHTLGVGTERIETALSDAGVEASRRAETLTLEEWSRLAAALWSQ